MSPWLRVGDTAATDPRVSELRVVAKADSRTRNEVFGFVTLAATVSAAHLTDGVLTAGDLAGVGDARWKTLTAQAVEAGLLVPLEAQGRPSWRVVDDPDLFNIITKEEHEWNQQRDRDRRNPALMAPVRMRDGDSCRYCAKAVTWADRKSARGATLDHLNPGRPAATADEAVIACRSCNSSRKNNPDALELLPAPAQPIYSAGTLEYLNRHRKHLTKGQQTKLDRAIERADHGEITEKPPTSSTTRREWGTVDAGVGSGTGSGRVEEGQGRDGRPPAERAEEAS